MDFAGPTRILYRRHKPTRVDAVQAAQEFAPLLPNSNAIDHSTQKRAQAGLTDYDSSAKLRSES